MVGSNFPSVSVTVMKHTHSYQNVIICFRLKPYHYSIILCFMWRWQPKLSVNYFDLPYTSAPSIRRYIYYLWEAWLVTLNAFHYTIIILLWYGEKCAYENSLLSAVWNILLLSNLENSWKGYRLYTSYVCPE